MSTTGWPSNVSGIKIAGASFGERKTSRPSAQMGAVLNHGECTL